VATATTPCRWPKWSARTGKIYAVDVQPEMIEMLRQNIERKGLKNIVPINGLYHDPKLPPNSCDMILLVDVYHEFSHPVQMLAGMRAGLKPDGQLVLVEFRAEDESVPIKPEHKMSKAQIHKEMNANGFVMKREFDGLPWQHLMFFGKDGQAVSVDLNQMGGVRTLTKEEAADSLQYAVVDAKTGFTNSLGMKFVPVPGTRVLMCVHEVRMLDWKACVKKVRGLDSKESRGWSDDQPVQLNWDEALAFCEWLSQEDGLGYRVSTDREWSFSVGIGQDEVADALPAMLGGKIKDQYPWGAVWPPPQGAGNYPDQTFIDETKPKDGFTIPAYNDGFALASPVMSFAPNHLGIYDLGGNLWEWTSSWYDGRQDSRSVRGAGFMLLTNQETLLSSCRGSVSLGSKSGRGLRVVIEVPQ
jgi:SAM-dependent methyltransferase